MYFVSHFVICPVERILPYQAAMELVQHLPPPTVAAVVVVMIVSPLLQLLLVSV
jgi:hypothetical protein